MTFFRRLLVGCYSHLDLRERDAQGKAILVCQTCGDVREMLPGQKFKARKEKKPRKARKSAEILKPTWKTGT